MPTHHRNQNGAVLFGQGQIPTKKQDVHVAPPIEGVVRGALLFGRDLILAKQVFNSK